eukprot:6206492-Pleurochrysis_carterae.AAC.4
MQRLAKHLRAREAACINTVSELTGGCELLGVRAFEPFGASLAFVLAPAARERVAAGPRPRLRRASA